MRSTTRFSLRFSGATAAAAYVFGWLLTGEGSPFYHYFLYHVSLPNAWASLNVVPVILGFVVSGNPHSHSAAGEVVSVLAFVAQWALVGFVLSRPLAGLRRGPR